jgi:ABC-type sugar transport systems, ATPase components
MLPENKAKVLLYKGYVSKEVILGIRPEDIHDEEIFINTSKNSLIKAQLDATEMLGAEIYLYLKFANQNIIARVDSRSNVQVNDIITLGLDTNRMHIFDKESEKVIIN